MRISFFNGNEPVPIIPRDRANCIHICLISELFEGIIPDNLLRGFSVFIINRKKMGWNIDDGAVAVFTRPEIKLKIESPIGRLTPDLFEIILILEIVIFEEGCNNQSGRAGAHVFNYHPYKNGLVRATSESQDCFAPNAGQSECRLTMS